MLVDGIGPGLKQRIIERLRELRTASGVGAREFNVETLGKGRQWLDNRQLYAFDVGDLFQVLDALDVDPLKFFREILNPREEVPKGRGSQGKRFGSQGKRFPKGRGSR